VKSFVEVEGAALAEVALNHLFRVHPDIYEPARSVIDGGRHSKSEPLIATLLRYGVLAETSGRIHFESIMIEEGMRLYNAKRLLPANAPQPSDDGAAQPLRYTLDEWADELALINAQRNKLEKRLRSMALNFIKFSSLQTQGGDGPSARIHKAIEKMRQDKLKQFPADDLIEKLLWSELVRLIEKEWQLFSPIFHDLRLFKEHSSIVNDRPDTHAKEVDAADLARYRSSLRWLEDAVQRAST